MKHSTNSTTSSICATRRCRWPSPLLGVTALTRKRWLLGVAIIFLGLGAFFGVAGFVGLPIHPETAIKWLA